MTVNIQASSFDDLKGVMQIMRDDAGQQAIGLLNAVNKALGYTTTATPRITVNEAFRNKARQDLKWAQYLAGGVLAADPYNSNHGPQGDINNGIAIDIGVTEVDGSNRALNANEQAVWRSLENDWGYQSIGDTFATPESWHKEYRLAPKNIEAAGVKLATVPVPPAITHKEKLMLRQATGAKAGTNGDVKNFVFLVDPENKTVRRITNANELSELKKDFTLRTFSQAVLWDFVRPDSIGYKRIGF